MIVLVNLIDRVIDANVAVRWFLLVTPAPADPCSR